MLEIRNVNTECSSGGEVFLSWKLASSGRDIRQTAYRITAADEQGTIVWDSGDVRSEDSVCILLKGFQTEPCSNYRACVTVLDSAGEKASGECRFETGLSCPPRDLSCAKWIASPAEDCPPVFIRTFTVPEGIVSARLYLTARGIYEAALDGVKLGDGWFAPGWTSYQKRLQVQTLPVTLTPGEHTLSVTAANGWYKGALGFWPTPNRYGDRLAILGMLRMVGGDGSARTLVTDDSWRVTTGPVRSAEFYYGEVYDASAIPAEPTEPVICDFGYDNLVMQEGRSVGCTLRLPVVSSFVTPRGEWVMDFGQNITGVVEASLNLPAGASVRLRHAESLDENGNFYTDNLSFAKSEDTFISGGSPFVYTPRFTYHGFRYLCVEGIPEERRDPAAFTACVLTTPMAGTGSFLCSDPRINQLQNNIRWSQSDNFLEIPTDCPQRSERLGWTGDIRAYARTALFNSDAAGFLRKWLRDLKADQAEDGAVPYVVPNILDAPGGPVSTASFWGDSATVVPWEVYMATGNANVLQEQYGSMKAWVDCITARCGENGLWQSGYQYGDWLGLDAERTGLTDERVGATDVYFLANISYADSAGIVSRAAEVLGNSEDARKYAALREKIIAAFREEYLTRTGRMVSETQTAYTMALEFDMLPEALRPAAAGKLAQSVASHKNHIITGFVGTPFVCDALSANGYHDLAGKVVLQEENPGWLYEVNMGATTIWERWDSILPDRSFNPANMNSLNHYAYGSIGSWLYRRIGGIEPMAPGYRKIRIRPQPIEGITWARCSYDSPYGLIRCDWRCENHRLTMDVEIPVGCSAEVTLPGHTAPEILGSGVRRWSEETELELRKARYTMETQVKTVFSHPAAIAILKQHAPDFLENPMMEYVMDNTLNELLAYSPEGRPLFEGILQAMNEQEE